MGRWIFQAKGDSGEIQQPTGDRRISAKAFSDCDSRKGKKQRRFLLSFLLLKQKRDLRFQPIA